MRFRATELCQAVASVWGYAEVEEPCPMHMFLVDWLKDKSFWVAQTRRYSTYFAYDNENLSTLGLNYAQELDDERSWDCGLHGYERWMTCE